MDALNTVWYCTDLSAQDFIIAYRDNSIDYARIHAGIGSLQRNSIENNVQQWMWDVNNLSKFG